MKQLPWCVLIVAVAFVAGCAAPPAQDEAVAEPETEQVETEAGDVLVEEGFESGETGELTPGGEASGDETASDG